MTASTVQSLSTTLPKIDYCPGGRKSGIFFHLIHLFGREPHKW